MNKIIIVMGDLATGKSTFSKILAKRYNAILLNKDDIKEILGDTIGFANRKENKKLSDATFKIMSHAFERIAISNQDIILEANFHGDELQILYRQVEALGYECMTIVLYADIDVLYKRFMNRVDHEHRHPVHITEDLIEYQSFRNYILKSRNVMPMGNVIKVDANDFLYQEESNLGKIDDFFNKKTLLNL